MNLTAIICKVTGKHKPYHRPRKHKWHIWCSRCGKELVEHNPEPKVAPYKVEPLKLLTFQEMIAKANQQGEAEIEKRVIYENIKGGGKVDDKQNQG